MNNKINYSSLNLNLYTYENINILQELKEQTLSRFFILFIPQFSNYYKYSIAKLFNLQP